MKVNQIFALATDLGFYLGVRDLHKLGAPWVHKVNSDWTIAFNCNENPVEADPGDGGMIVNVPPMSIVVWWHGWLAGLVDPVGGTIADHPNGANAERLVADLEAAIEEARRFDA